MHTVELLATALDAARQLGFQVREECLGGDGGGPCEIAGKKWLFLDLEQSRAEQLAVVMQLLREEQAAESTESSANKAA